jgi:hypothetical protein
MAWSSTSTILIRRAGSLDAAAGVCEGTVVGSGRRGGGAPGERQAEDRDGAGAGRGGEFAFSSQRFHPFPDAEQAEFSPAVLAVGQFRHVESDAFILDADPQLPLLIDVDRDDSAICLGMFDDVEQQFADRLKQENGLVVGQGKRRRTRFDRDLKRVLLHPLSQPDQRFGEAELVEDVRAQFGHERSGVGQGLIQHPVHVRQRGGCGFILNLGDGLRKPEPAGHDELRKIVVQFNGEPSALALFSQRQFRGQCPQPFLRQDEFMRAFLDATFELSRGLLQLAFRAFPFREVHEHVHPADQFSGRVAKGGGVGCDRDPGSVRAFNDRFKSAYRAIEPEALGERTGCKRHGATVWPVDPP